MSENETLIARMQEQIKTLFGDMAELKADVKQLKEEFANRLPNWATVLIAILTALLGGCIGKILG